MSNPTSLPSRIFNLLKQVLGDLLDSTQNLIAENAMDILFGFLTLLLGWMIASVGRGLFSKLSRAAGVDIIADRTGLRNFMIRSDIHKPVSKLLGYLVYAMILYATTLVAFDAMGLNAASDFLRKLASYIPRACVVFVLLVLGVGLGKLVKSLCTRAARISGLPMPDFIGSFCRFAVILFAIFLALNYLEVASIKVLFYGSILVIAVTLLLSILFTIAARKLTESLLSHPFLKSTYSRGDHISFEGCAGEVLKIDATTTHILEDDCIRVVPNHIITSQTVRLKK